MKPTLLRMTLGLAGILWLHGTSLAQDTDGITTTVAFGAAYTTGSYGTDSDIEDLYAPLSAIFEGERVSFRITVPYLSVTAPEGTVYDPDGVPIQILLIADRETGLLLGGEIVGTEGAALRINTLATALAGHMTVADLQNLDLVYAPPFASVWDPVLVAANQLIKKVGG